MDIDDITQLDTQVVADHAIHTGGAIVKIVVGEHGQDGVLALLALDQDGVATEELKSLQGVVGQRDDGVVIVHRIGNTVVVPCISI